MKSIHNDLSILFIFSTNLLIDQWQQIIIDNNLGQKVATLVNKKEQAGVYQVEWDASQFSSGIYYYRIEVVDPARRTVEFQDVKKMILLR